MQLPKLLIGITFALALLACTLGPAVTPTLPPPAPGAFPTDIPASTVPARVDAPAWWPTDLAMPRQAIPNQGRKGQPTWNADKLSADDIKSELLSEAKSGGYQSYVVTLSPGSIYDLLFVKAGVTYAVNITQGTETTILTGERVGTMHLQITGAVNATVDLPLRDRFDLTPGSEIAFGTSVPAGPCSQCQYLVYIHIAPFNGPGVYESKPAGAYLVDVQLDPGGDLQQEDYRWAQQCTVIIQDAQAGSFACAGLQNINDDTKRLNMTGSWQQPPASP